MKYIPFTMTIVCNKRDT